MPDRGGTRRAGATDGLGSGTTGSQSQLLGARQGRGAQEAHLVHASARCWSTGSAPIFRCPASIRTAWEQIFNTQAGGILGMFNMFSGGGIHRMAIFALNIMPYISASIIIQLMTTVSPTLEALKKEGEAGRKIMNQYTRYLPWCWPRSRPTASPSGCEGTGSVVSEPGCFFLHLDHDHAHRRHHVPDVAGRADHRARHRQRHLADHPGRHRRASCRRRSPARSNSAARARCRPA